ncbi:hypothetical protein HQQ81_13165 [Microbacteriaceae bacterium VKM Ac-2854]|nr:hypothetical protein [Microbacteriaceae bacterium VKM Ac-2854]
MHARSTLGLLAVLAALALAGCTSGGAAAPSASATATATPTATPTPVVAPLTCADLIGPAQAATALAADAALVDPLSMEMFDPTLAAIPAAGGLSCEWAPAPTGSAVARLELSVLPGTTGENPACIALGDEPCAADREVPRYGDTEAQTGCGDPGCVFSALVGDTWVVLEVHNPGQSGAGGVLGSPDVILSTIGDAATQAFSTIAAADPAALAWPSTAPAMPASCESYLPLSAAGALINDDSVQWRERSAPVAGQRTLQDAAIARAGFIDCDAAPTSTDANTVGAVTFTAMPGDAALLTRFTQAQASRAEAPLPLQPETIDGQPAFVFRDGGGTARMALFGVGADAVFTEGSLAGSDAQAVAAAILAHAG